MIFHTSILQASHLRGMVWLPMRTEWFTSPKLLIIGQVLPVPVLLCKNHSHNLLTRITKWRPPKDMETNAFLGNENYSVLAAVRGKTSQTNTYRVFLSFLKNRGFIKDMPLNYLPNLSKAQHHHDISRHDRVRRTGLLLGHHEVNVRVRRLKSN